MPQAALGVEPAGASTKLRGGGVEGREKQHGGQTRQQEPKAVGEERSGYRR